MPYVAVTDCLKAIISISVANCSYCLTIYTPHDSLNYHSTLTLSYFGSQKSACMCLTFHVHEKNHDSEKAPFLQHEFAQMNAKFKSVNRAIILREIWQSNKENLE